jgi:hypothetical protein
MTRLILAALFLAAPAAAQQVQKDIGMTGTMYNGNNTTRSSIGTPPNPHPPKATGQTPGATVNKDESGTGAGGGEH